MENGLIRMLDHMYYWILNRFFKRYDLIRTGLNKSGWHEIEERMLYGMMGMLEEYVDNQYGMRFIDWSEHPKIEEKIWILYHWWKNYPNRLQENEESLTNWVYHKGKKKDKEAFEHSMYLKKKLENEETQALQMLVEIRKSLWT